MKDKYFWFKDQNENLIAKVLSQEVECLSWI